LKLAGDNISDIFKMIFQGRKRSFPLLLECNFG